MSEKIRFIPDLKGKILNTVSVLTEQQNWGLSFIDAQEAWRHSQGEGVKVAVIDTGWTEHKDLIPNFVEGHDATGNNDFIDRGNFHGCVLPTDKIWTTTSGIIEIRDLYNAVTPDAVFSIPKENAIVKTCESSDHYTHSYFPDGTFKKSKINCVHNIKYKGDIYEIQTNKKNSLSLTPWHPIYIIDDKGLVLKKEADQIKIGDKILAASSAPCVTEIDVTLNEGVQCKYCNHIPVRGSGLRLQCRSCNKLHWAEAFKNTIKLNEDLAYWLGLVLSDGHIMSSSQSIEFCGNDIRLIEQFEQLTLKIFNKECFRYTQKDRINCLRTRVHSKIIYDFVQYKCGINSGKKSLSIDVPKLIQRSPMNIVGAFYAGIIEGDGCVYGNRIRICTGSKVFAQTTKVLLNTYGIHCNIETRLKQSGFGIGNPCYYLDIQSHPEITKLSYTKCLGKKIHIRERKYEIVKSINIIKYDGEVYDLTVSNTHNYIANGLVVSNTHVAGIIAANCGDGIGVMGVAPSTKLIPIKALSDDGSGSFDYIVRALEIAMGLDVDVINMSLGTASDPGTPQIHNLLQEIAKQGKIVVCASGNDGASVNFPARYDEVIAVAAVESSGQLARFSSRGPELDTAAPGVKIYSTWGNNQYTNLDGTSMACPCISGMVSLILSWYKQNPDPTFIKDYKNMIKLLYGLGESSIIQTNEYNIGVPKFANFNPWKPVNA
jgi:subtilisin family serine protease